MNANTLMEQSPATVNYYLSCAVEAVKKFEIPESQRGVIIAAYIAACAADFDTAIKHA